MLCLEYQSMCQRLQTIIHLDNLGRRLENTHDFVRNELRISSDSMEAIYVVIQFTKKKGSISKHWEGPYTVIMKLNDVVYRIRKSPRCKMKVVHADILSPYTTSGTFDRDKIVWEKC